MRLLLLNPNTTEALTERMASVARGIAAETTVIDAITAPRGLPYIATRAEAVIGGAIALEMLADLSAPYDAVIMAAFGDPALNAARELLSVPVVGLAEASILTACMLGRRFSIVTFSANLAPWFEECVAANGMGGRLASLRVARQAFSDIDLVQAEMTAALVEAATLAAREDGAEVIILGGAPLAGLARRVAPLLPVPVIDSVEAATRMAETLALLKPRKAEIGSFRLPDGKPTVGLPAALASLLGGGG
ncbi:aspartate/glutamate racemase family protein [Acidisoma cellulosilytica]|uniref:Aspartate/glutamate racemase family protein n=1 Tax=Acidisoma cellulosilyticum TaxID=2802395 RepID=A0A964E4D3_9PROT|nr:aspartate/glutamate racemase family protein [Acidisoma cellulosilyticum]MCB8881354.1 aspartate/glutamate racemase family protein [Acidisoma cellulosilyticum]